MLVNAEAAQVLSERGLDTLVESGEVWSAVLLGVTLEAVDSGVALNIVAHLDVVVVDLSVDASGLNDHSLLARLVSNQDSKVNEVFGLAALLVFAFFFLLVLRIIRQWLSINISQIWLVFDQFTAQFVASF